MSKFLPDMYKKDIYAINYEKLKKFKIRVLLFDFDNTIIEKGNYSVNSKTFELINRLKKDFSVFIVSNSLHASKLKKVCNDLGINYIGDSRKPFKKGFKKLNISESSSVAMIGDQVITDVLGGNRMGYFTVLVDPISKSEHIFTKINRVFEKIILENIDKKRGCYYD